MNIEKLKYIFREDSPNAADWQVVVDGVMGGKSQATIEHTHDSIVLKGHVSLDNNGGFASMRTKELDFDLSRYNSVEIRYRSTGLDFSFYLNRYRKHYEPKFRTELPVTDGEWTTIEVALVDFKIMKLGKEIVAKITKEDLSKIIKLGFISKTKAATNFTLEVDQVVFK